jgi:hypothetical protein
MTVPSGVCPECRGEGFTLVEAVQLPSGRMFVVPRDTYDAALQAVRCAADSNSVQAVLDAALAALFAPGTVRVAKAVGRAAVFYRDGSDVWLPYDHGDSTDPDSRYIVGVTDGGRMTEATGDTIAILEPEPGKEAA